MHLSLYTPITNTLSAMSAQNSITFDSSLGYNRKREYDCLASKKFHLVANLLRALKFAPKKYKPPAHRTVWLPGKLMPPATLILPQYYPNTQKHWMRKKDTPACYRASSKVVGREQ
jgi:hypothetical protein